MPSHNMKNTIIQIAIVLEKLLHLTKNITLTQSFKCVKITTISYIVWESIPYSGPRASKSFKATVEMHVVLSINYF